MRVVVRMTAKRFTLIECNGNIEDGYTQSVYDGGEDVFELLDLLNKLYEENNEEELNYFKSKCGSLEEKLFYINRENEQLKQQLEYIQNSISEHIKHQKTELGQKALKEIIEDYNEWLLGHKELKE